MWRGPRGKSRRDSSPSLHTHTHIHTIVSHREEITVLGGRVAKKIGHVKFSRAVRRARGRSRLATRGWLARLVLLVSTVRKEGTRKCNEEFELRVKKYLSFLVRLRYNCTKRWSDARVPIQRPSRKSIDTRHLPLARSLSLSLSRFLSLTRVR